MSTRKRKAEDCIEYQAAKLPRTDSPSQEHNHESNPTPKVSLSGDSFAVKTKVRSRRKAAQNDPKPTDCPQDQHDLPRAEENLDPSEISRVQEVENNEPEESSDGSGFDEFAGTDWFEAMDGVVTCTQDLLSDYSQNAVGTCHGGLIRRDIIRATFYHDMAEPSRETSLLAFDIFDRYGRLRSEAKDHAARKGSGVWSEELDRGDILLIEKVIVEKEYRRRGLGKMLVESMVSLTRSKSEEFFAVVWPDFLIRAVAADFDSSASSEEKEQACDRARAAAAQFFRSLGFRRIGSTRWFGFTDATDHPSRLLAPEDDYDTPKPTGLAADPNIQLLQQDLVHSPDQECLTALSSYLQQTPATGLSWQGTDAQGNTILHLASLSSKAASVEWIIKQEFGLLMLKKRNHGGDLPLEAVVMHLEDMRTRRVHKNSGTTLPISDEFDGHSEAAVRVLIALRGLTAPTDLDRARLALGCTCNQCVSGFLSPRMRLALLCQAEIQHDMLSGLIELQSGPEWVDSCEDALEFLPSRVCKNLTTNKSMRQGFANICDHIATCLKAKEVPNALNVEEALDEASEWPPVTKNFLQRGGSFESVALMIFQCTMDQDALAGNGAHEATFGEEIGKLPKCRNDHEFGFVSGMCGYKRISQMRDELP